MTAPRTSRIPLVRAALFNLLESGMSGPDVFYGWDGNDASTDRVIVGGVINEGATQGFQSFGGSQFLAREESFRLLVMIRVTVTGNEAQEAYERAYDWLAQIELLLRADAQLGLVDQGVQVASIEQVDEEEQPGAEGWWCGMDVHVRFKTNI